MTPRILVAFYSRTGNTRRVARLLADALGDADLEELMDPTPRMGVRGYLRSGYQAFFKRRTPLAPLRHDPARYDLVILCTPVWNASVSAPARAFLAAHARRIHRIAFLACFGGFGLERVLRQLTEANGTRPLATTAVRESDLASGQAEAIVTRFAAELRTRLEAPQHTV
ncbi:MAG TPA: NAD(P)H-dependent oxidoreductase [Gemmatimonadaceae bacterium]|jgi:flavodoxin|nr:NAD(P)H-dependent oxidoreductase [Gemmatimonadaceae bacterium]